MQRKSTLLSGVALGAIASFGLIASANATPAKHHHHLAAKVAVADDRVAALTTEVETLESRLTAESLAREQLEGKVQSAQAQAQSAQADAQAAHQQLAEQIQTIPGEVKADVAAASKPTSPITIKMGGFAAAESVYRSKDDVADISSNYAKIPFANSTTAHTGETHLTARQSRYSILASGNIDQDTTAAFYGEFDFLGAAQTANSNESNSYTPRIRNLYGEVNWNASGWHFLFGQNWSLATLNSKGITPRNEVPPPTIEAQYVPGFTWARQPQLRVTKDFANKQVWLAVSVENPATIYSSAATGISSTASGITSATGATGVSGYNSANTVTFNHVPDVIAKIAVEPDFGGAKPIHLEAYGLYRGFTDRVTAGANTVGVTPGIYGEQTTGGGFGGGVTWTVVPKLLDLEASALTGKGIGRYGTSGLPDATLTPTGAVAPIQETMWLAGGTLHATSQLDLYVFGGEETEQNKFYNIGANKFGFGNPLANMTNCFVENASCTANLKQVSQVTAGFWDKVYTGSFGQVRVGVQYSHTQLDAFSGVGGSPKTTDDMVFTSFRYYPF